MGCLVKIDLGQDDKVKLLIYLAHLMGISSDEILALYLILEDRIFAVFDLLQGKVVKFPTLRTLRTGLSGLGGFQLQKLTKSHYTVNGIDSYREDIKRGDKVSLCKGVDVDSLSSPLMILGETYILCKVKG